MALDPELGFNPQLPAVSNAQTARLRLDCGDRWYFEAPTRIVLPGGGVLRSTGGLWPAAASALPANAVIRQHGSIGQGRVLQDNTAQIDQVLEYPSDGACGIARTPREGRRLLPGVVNGKFQRLGALLEAHEGALPAELADTLAGHVLAAQSAWSLGDTRAAIDEINAFAEAVKAASGSVIPDVWRSSRDLTNVAGELRAAAGTLRFSLSLAGG